MNKIKLMRNENVCHMRLNRKCILVLMSGLQGNYSVSTNQLDN